MCIIIVDFEQVNAGWVEIKLFNLLWTCFSILGTLVENGLKKT